MESRAYALITGLFVLGVAACIVVWAQWLAKTPLARTEYRVVATGPVSLRRTRIGICDRPNQPNRCR